MDASDQAGPGPQSAATRAKDRLAKQMRPLVCERSMLQRADGSAKWGQDGSVVLAAVYGPRQVSQGRREQAERAVLEVVVRPREGPPGTQERAHEDVIRQTLEGVVLVALHPRTAIMVILQVVQADGSLLSCCLNAACAALVDAGIPMSHLFASVTCAFTRSRELLLDPDASEEEAAAAVVCAAYRHSHSLSAGSSGGGDSSSSGQGQLLVVEPGVLTLHSLGSLEVEQLMVGLEACRRGCEGVAKFYKLTLLHSFKAALTSSQKEAA